MDKLINDNGNDVLFVWHNRKHSGTTIYRFGGTDKSFILSETYFSFPFCKWKRQRSLLELNEIVNMDESIINTERY